MKKLIALFMALLLCFSFSCAYAGEDDVISSEHTENVEVITPTPRGDWSVSISSSLDGLTQVMTDTEVTLTASLYGFREGVDTWTIQWQVNKGDGWEDLSGETSETYKFNINETNVRYKWRVVVHVIW